MLIIMYIYGTFVCTYRQVFILNLINILIFAISIYLIIILLALWSQMCYDFEKNLSTLCVSTYSLCEQLYYSQ